MTDATEKTAVPRLIEQEGEGDKTPPKIKFWNKPSVLAVRESPFLNFLLCLLIPMITIVTLEWIARGTLGPHEKDYGFFQALDAKYMSFVVSYMLLICIYVCVLCLSKWHALATAVVGLVGNIPAVVTYYKLTMRGEPFLPWDLMQIQDLLSIKDHVQMAIQPSMIITLLIFILLIILAGFVRLPVKEDGKQNIVARAVVGGLSLAGLLGLLFGIFLSPEGTAAINVKEDMWMQDRYYRTYGVITGFLTNLQVLQIEVPENYSEATVKNIVEETRQSQETGIPYAGNETPDIIFLMAESFWDMEALEGIEYDRDLMPNFKELALEGASGYAYTPSFGGGTCDVEFEALTGYSMEHLPAASKPFQQYTTQQLDSLPNYLKTKGYTTLAIHGYGRRFWSRDQAYPELGIDTFIASEDFENPELRRGFISDNAMVDRIIEEYENREVEDAPLFIHAVTMQNHTTYDRNRYPSKDLVHVDSAPSSLPDSTISQLEDCATGISEMDAALGKMADYLRTVDRPTILVFWGDHLNPMTDGYTIFEETGYIDEGDTTSPNLHKTPLLIWSNYSDEPVDLGTMATYNISPVLMDMYGLEMPLFFEMLVQNMDVMTARTRGYTVNPDGSITDTMTPEQEDAFEKHGILQYDSMFGEQYTHEGEN